MAVTIESYKLHVVSAHILCNMCKMKVGFIRPGYLSPGDSLTFRTKHNITLSEKNSTKAFTWALPFQKNKHFFSILFTLKVLICTLLVNKVQYKSPQITFVTVF